MLETIVKAIDDKKGKDIRVIDMSMTSPMVDGFVICHATNERQLMAIKEGIVEELEKEGFDRPKVEGLRGSKWILLDCKEYIVHIFDEEERATFNLEKLWGDLPVIDVSDYLK